MLAGSRRSHPMSFFLRVATVERLQRERLLPAIAAALRCHPLLTATTVRHRGRWMWQPIPPAPQLDQHVWGKYADSSDDWHIDLENQPGVRFSIADAPADTTTNALPAQPPQSELWLQVHHSCCDGRGILNFLNDVRTNYQQPLSASQLRAREQQALQTLPQRATGFSQQLAPYLNPVGPRWNRIHKYYGHRSQPLATSLAISNDSPECLERLTASSPSSTLATIQYSPSYVSRQLPLDANRFRARGDPSKSSAAVRPTINDHILHGLFQALAEHQLRASNKPANPWLRIGVPIDMRSPAKEPYSACNCSSLVFLDRRLNTIRQQSHLLGELHAEMQLVKQHRLGSVFFDCLAVAHALPGMMRVAVNDRRCAVSAVASNLGIVQFPPAAGFTIHSLDALPPLRPGTAVALGLMTINAQLNMALHYDQRLISTSDASHLIDSLSTYMS